MIRIGIKMKIRIRIRIKRVWIRYTAPRLIFLGCLYSGLSSGWPAGWLQTFMEMLHIDIGKEITFPGFNIFIFKLHFKNCTLRQRLTCLKAWRGQCQHICWINFLLPNAAMLSSGCARPNSDYLHKTLLELNSVDLTFQCQ
jgi:hypothetical protein